MNTTCGVLYQQCLDRMIRVPKRQRSPLVDGVEWAFAIGFIAGQAEKVYNDVCIASMIRPSNDKFDECLGRVHQICSIYKLSRWTYLLHEEETRREIWIFKKSRRTFVKKLDNLIKNSPEWHRHRAILCGIPEDKVDITFHEREGYGKRCD